MTIAYIHGFASNGQGDKQRILREAFPDRTVLSPDLPVSPKEAIALLEARIPFKEASLAIAGTSLGGFYALYLSAKYGTRALLVNPTTNPSAVMHSAIGANINYATNEPFMWRREHLGELALFEREIANMRVQWENIGILIGRQDDVVDPNVTRAYFQNKPVRIFEFDDTHRFSRFEEAIQMPAIRTLFE